MIRVVSIEPGLPLEKTVRHALAADGIENAQPEPTHALLDASGTIWGAFCFTYVPCVMLWLNRRETALLGKHRALHAVEAFYAEHGHRRLLLILHESSALYPFAGRAGYSLLGPCELFTKDLNQPNPLHGRTILKAQIPAPHLPGGGEC